MKTLNCYKIVKDLFYINRSLTGRGNVKTLKYLKKIVPKLKIKYFRSGEKFYDWTIPKEWNVKDAYIQTKSGKKIADFKKNNLHLVGYSRPINKIIKKNKLLKHIHTTKKNKKAIPYVTSYYKTYWGFCLSDIEKSKINEDEYLVNINSELKKGKMHYGELIHKGESKKEILISTYICHPSMANNELSGVSVATKLAEWICKKKRKFTYRFIFVPETIGTIAYIKKNFEALKKNTIGGYVVTCVGDSGNFSYMPSRDGNTLSDRVVKYIFKKKNKYLKKYSFNDRGSQERQFCSPIIDLPIASIMKTKYGNFKEYHTSEDNLDFVNNKNLNQSLDVYIKILNFFEKNRITITNQICEPMFSKKNIYPTISLGRASNEIKILRNLVGYSDGKTFLFEIAKKINLKFEQAKKKAKYLKNIKLIKYIN